jgi:hypothetical protein
VKCLRAHTVRWRRSRGRLSATRSASGSGQALRARPSAIAQLRSVNQDMFILVIWMPIRTRAVSIAEFGPYRRLCSVVPRRVRHFGAQTNLTSQG